MGVRILIGKEDGTDSVDPYAVLYDSVTGLPIEGLSLIEARDDLGLSAHDVADGFLYWLEKHHGCTDLRRVSPTKRGPYFDDYYDGLLAEKTDDPSEFHGVRGWRE